MSGPRGVQIVVRSDKLEPLPGTPQPVKDKIKISEVLQVKTNFAREGICCYL